MTYFHLSFSTLLWRYYLMMAIILLAGFTGYWALAFLSLPVFLSCLLGVSFRRQSKQVEATMANNARRHTLTQTPARAQHAA